MTPVRDSELYGDIVWVSRHRTACSFPPNLACSHVAVKERPHNEASDRKGTLRDPDAWEGLLINEALISGRYILLLGKPRGEEGAIIIRLIAAQRHFWLACDRKERNGECRTAVSRSKRSSSNSAESRNHALRSDQSMEAYF